MYLVIAGFVVLATLFWYLGWKWESGLKRPALVTNPPLVSVIISSFNSAACIGECIKSAKEALYPKKEIMVADDCSTDGTPNICKQFGVGCIKNSSRLGKALSLNNAAKKAAGEILLFLDADTTISRDSLKKMAPWFSSSETNVVVPRHVAKKSGSILSKLITIENMFNSTLYRAHMFFGSMLTFRGCCVAVRGSFFRKMGGWPNTLLEDNEFASLAAKYNSKIQYEPDALAETAEAETFSQLKRQRIRWGKGTAYSFWRHRGEYGRHPLFFIQFLPYVLLLFAATGFIFWDMGTLLLPLIPLSIAYSFSIKEIASLLVILVLPLLSNMAVVAAGGVSHMAIAILPEKNKSSALYILPYIFIFVPLVTIFYLKGVVAAVRDRRAGKPELDLGAW